MKDLLSCGRDVISDYAFSICLTPSHFLSNSGQAERERERHIAHRQGKKMETSFDPFLLRCLSLPSHFAGMHNAGEKRCSATTCPSCALPCTAMSLIVNAEIVNGISLSPDA